MNRSHCPDYLIAATIATALLIGCSQPESTAVSRHTGVPASQLNSIAETDVSTCIFVNFREITPREQLHLQRLFGYTVPGEYWLDDDGNFGRVGDEAAVNLYQPNAAAQGNAPMRSSNSPRHLVVNTLDGRSADLP